MRCVGCGLDNRPERRFCAGCGAALAAACVRCGFANLPGERFCGGCGGGLEATAPVGERRQVAILFADLAGYTRLSTTLDPEEVHRLLTGFFDAVDGVCARFGGSIDKHIGDNVMAIFGAPVAHGDDPERAVRAAVEIHRAVEAYAQRVGTPLKVHVGVAYGEVIASGLGSAHHQEYTVTGDAVNLAARLQDKAVGGETMISDAVYRAAARIAIADRVDDVAVKGLADPVAVWKLRDVRATATAPTRLVGRQAEFATIAARLDRVRAERRGALIVVRGEAGIGKSTLTAEVMRRAGDAGFAVHAGLVLDFGQGRGAAAVPSLVASLLGAPGGVDDPGRRAALDAAIASRAISADDAPHLASLLELEVEDDAVLEDRERRDRQLGALARLIAVAPRPLLLVVEDVHWADVATLGRLRHAVAAAAQRDAAVLVTTRIDGDPIDAEWRAAADTTVVDLEPLDAADAARLAGDHLVDGELIARCVARAGGNPLFLEQLVHSATADAVLPGTLQGLVLARVDRLPARDKAALQAAAIGGQRASLTLVRHLTGDRGWDPAELIGRRLLRPQDGDALVFHHALILDGVYASLTHARRRELHRAAATHYAGLDDDLHAEHLERAGDGGAAAAWLAAARRHAALHDSARALTLADRGLACAARDDDRHPLHELAGRLLLDIGDGPAALPRWRAALASAPDDRSRCRALIGVAAVYRLTVDLDGARRALDDAAALAAPLGLDLELAQIAYYRGNLAFTGSDLDVCRTQHQRALEHARRASAPEWEARALSGLGDAMYMSCDFADAARAFTACDQLATSLGLVGFALINRAMVADSIHYLLRVDEALRLLDEVIDEAARLGLRRAEALALESAAIVRSQCGRHDGLDDLNQRSRTLCSALEMRNFVITSYIVEVRLCVAEGRLERAHAAVAEGIALCAGLETSFMSVAMRTVAALVTPDAAARAELIATGVAAVAPRSLGAIMVHDAAIDAALRYHDWATAAAHADLLDRALGDIPYAGFIATHGRVLARWGAGARDPATLDELTELRARAAATGMRLPLPSP